MRRMRMVSILGLRMASLEGRSHISLMPNTTKQELSAWCCWFVFARILFSLPTCFGVLVYVSLWNVAESVPMHVYACACVC